MHSVFVTCCFFLAVTAISSTAQAEPVAASTADQLDESLVLEAKSCLRRAGHALLAAQLPNGSWAGSPAVTSLCTLALLNLPTKPEADVEPHLGQALDYIAGNAQSTGSIAPGGTQQYPVFTTAVSIFALARANRTEDTAILRRARQFLLQAQNQAAEPASLLGGFANAPQQAPDLTTTEFALEALYLTDKLDRTPLALDPDAGRRADQACQLALGFVSRCQAWQAPTDTSAPEPHDAVNDKYYTPPGWFMDTPQSATRILPVGHATPRSIGFLTSAGLKSLIYGRTPVTDPRVQAAATWLRQHGSPQENPGAGNRGYFTYLFTYTRAINALTRAGSTAPPLPPQWRQDVVMPLISKQASSGLWQHQAPDWWENRPELATAYAMLTLELVLNTAPGS